MKTMYGYLKMFLYDYLYLSVCINHELTEVREINRGNRDVRLYLSEDSRKVVCI